MPLFGSKFSPKKPPIRKSNLDVDKESIEELVTDGKSVHLNLSDQKLIFQNGEWIPESLQHNAVYKSNQKLKKRLQELEEENNLWKLKYEMLLNMLTQKTAEHQTQQKEMDKLKRKCKI